ncbi:MULTISPECIES: hypothetical protein [unclassified Microcoleus]|uniref:hypothetical protein n=1 Tax=unclassified Microcoleus TaxID=2642155 RepID=UPI002FCF9A46
MSVGLFLSCDRAFQRPAYLLQFVANAGSRQTVLLPQAAPAREKRLAQRMPAVFLAIDCYAKTGNPPSAGYVNNSYCS